MSFNQTIHSPEALNGFKRKKLQGTRPALGNTDDPLLRGKYAHALKKLKKESWFSAKSYPLWENLWPVLPHLDGRSWPNHPILQHWTLYSHLLQTTVLLQWRQQPHLAFHVYSPHVQSPCPLMEDSLLGAQARPICPLSFQQCAPCFASAEPASAVLMLFSLPTSQSFLSVWRALPQPLIWSTPTYLSVSV